MRFWFKKLKRFRVADMQRLIDEHGAKLSPGYYGFWAIPEGCVLSMATFSVVQDIKQTRDILSEKWQPEKSHYIGKQTGFDASYLYWLEQGFEWPRSWLHRPQFPRSARLGYKDGFALRALVTKGTN